MKVNKRIILNGGVIEYIFQIRKNLIIEFLDKEYEVFVIVNGKSEKEEKRLKKMGVTVIFHEFNLKTLSPLEHLNIFIFYIKTIKSIRPDAILSYNVIPVIYGSIASKINKVQVITAMITGLGVIFSPKTVFDKIIKMVTVALYRVSLKNISWVFAQNDFILEVFDKYKISESKRNILIAGSGVDVDEFPYTPITSKNTFLFLSRFIKDKGVSEFVEAATILKRSWPESRFVVGGWSDGSKDSLSKKEVELLKVNRNIEYIGRVDDVKSVISESTVFVYPSYYNEGTPRTILEALSIGRPIITTTQPGCRDTVRNNLNGIIVKNRNITPLVEAMEKCIKNPELVKNMSLESRKLAEEVFDGVIVADKIFNKINTSFGYE
jgi:glycosyltransferase involved in cell wall biosynthesis